MPALDVALVTASKMPKPDPESHLLVEAIGTLGLRAEIVAWDGPAAWSLARLVVVRTPWDYFGRLPEFLDWTRHASSVSRLVNPSAVIAWNCHKRYLAELSQVGVATIPTTIVARGDRAMAETALANCPWPEVVIKPAISVGAIGAMRAAPSSDQAKRHLLDLIGDGDALVQPFASDVMEVGEVSLVYFDGRFSHAVRKQPKPGDYRVQDHHGGTVHPYLPAAEELNVAAAAIAVSPMRPIYARVDLVTFQDHPVVMELELIEPELFLPTSPSGTQRFAEVLAKELDPAGPPSLG